jgi:NAD(P)-dependent dehydrogenase (short-subunit alcohol dehydrogenase family)
VTTLSKWFGLDGMVAVVTGGSGALGSAMAAGLAAAGARVAIVGRDPARAEAAARAVGGLALPADVLDRAAPGIAEAIRADAISRTPHGLLSRGLAGVRGTTLVVNLPGSTGGCRDGYEVLRAALRHGLELAAGETATPHRQT